MSLKSQRLVDFIEILQVRSIRETSLCPDAGLAHLHFTGFVGSERNFVAVASSSDISPIRHNVRGWKVLIRSMRSFVASCTAWHQPSSTTELISLEKLPASRIAGYCFGFVRKIVEDMSSDRSDHRSMWPHRFFVIQTIALFAKVMLGVQFVPKNSNMWFGNELVISHLLSFDVLGLTRVQRWRGWAGHWGRDLR